MILFAMSLSKLRKNETIFAYFKQIVQSLNITPVDNKLRENIHMCVLLITNSELTPGKRTMPCSTKSKPRHVPKNLAFRTIIQTGGHEVLEKKQRFQTLGMKQTKARAKRKSQDPLCN